MYFLAKCLCFYLYYVVNDPLNEKNPVFLCNRAEYDYYKYHPMPEVRSSTHCSHTHFDFFTYHCTHILTCNGCRSLIG